MHLGCSMANPTSPIPPLCIVSHNVQRINFPVKHRKISQYYNSQKIDIIYLQVTHFPHKYSPSFIHPKVPTFYLANAGVKTKWVAIFLSHNCKFSLISEFKDPDGRFLLVRGLIENQLHFFVSYYVPNRGQAQFFNSMFRSVSSLTESIVIYSGDTNIAFDAGLDKTRPWVGASSVLPSRVYVARQICQRGLVDIWREVK